MNKDNSYLNEFNMDFNNYILEFKKLNIEDKKEEILKSIKDTIIVLNKMAELDNINLIPLTIVNEEIKKDTGDFYDLTIEGIENIKNIIGQYLEQKEDL